MRSCWYSSTHAHPGPWNLFISSQSRLASCSVCEIRDKLLRNSMASPGLLQAKPYVTFVETAGRSRRRAPGPPQLLPAERQVLGSKRRRVTPHQLRLPTPQVSTLQTSPDSNTSAGALVDELLEDIKGTGEQPSLLQPDQVPLGHQQAAV